MTDKQQPAQFDWATELSDAQGRVTLSEQEAHEIGARLRSLGAKLKAYEDLGDAADDMASAAAQGFRDGVASLSANAGEPVAHLWQHCETGRTRIVMPDMIVDADASWQVVGPLYLGATPPTAQAEGWTKPHRTITYTCPVCAASLERQE